MVTLDRIKGSVCRNDALDVTKVPIIPSNKKPFTYNRIFHL